MQYVIAIQLAANFLLLNDKFFKSYSLTIYDVTLKDGKVRKIRKLIKEITIANVVTFLLNKKKHK